MFGVGLGDQPAFVARYVGETSGGGRSRSCETGNEISTVRIVQFFELIKQNLLLHWNRYVSLRGSRTLLGGAAFLTGGTTLIWSETIVWTELSRWREKLCEYRLSRQSVSCMDQLSSCEEKKCCHGAPRQGDGSVPNRQMANIQCQKALLTISRPVPLSHITDSNACFNQIKSASERTSRGHREEDEEVVEKIFWF